MTTVKRKSKQLGQILIELGLITPEQLDTALEEHQKTPKPSAGVDDSSVTEPTSSAAAEQSPRFVDLTDTPIDPPPPHCSPNTRAAVPGAADRDRDGSGARADPRTSTRWTTSDDHRPRREARVATRLTSKPRSRRFAGWIPTSNRRRGSRGSEGRARPRSRAGDSPIVNLVTDLSQAVSVTASTSIEPGERD